MDNDFQRIRFLNKCLSFNYIPIILNARIGNIGAEQLFKATI